VNYSEQSVRYVFGDKLGDPDADAILGVLRAKPEGMTRTEINELFSHNISAGRMGAALAKLMELKLAHCIKLESTGGRRAERWYAITKNETEEAAQKWTV
jgi:hypothetical protein